MMKQSTIQQEIDRLFHCFNVTATEYWRVILASEIAVLDLRDEHESRADEREVGGVDRSEHALVTEGGAVVGGGGGERAAGIGARSGERRGAAPRQRTVNRH